uniref:Uncharacterized protein n=1 Tax=viral metagenome TaxID=1070528 RepID=A0A6M3KQ78_9ZZZZ
MEIEYRLTNAQRAAVLALHNERQRVMVAAQETVNDLGEAIEELALVYAEKAGLPIGPGELHFRVDGQGARLIYEEVSPPQDEKK